MGVGLRVHSHKLTLNPLGLRSRAEMDAYIWKFPKISDTFFEDHHNKDYSILRSILGFP